MLKGSGNSSAHDSCDTAPHPLGSELSSWRKARGCSIEQLAAKAVVAPSTLRRWERGETQPRLVELNRVMEVLQVPRAKRNDLLALIAAPRSSRGLKEQFSDQLGCWAPAELLPSSGALWRALRCRRGLTGRELARRLRVQPSAVSRWEKSEDAPSPDRLPELFAVLAATAEEQALLGSPTPLLGVPPGERYLTPEEGRYLHLMFQTRLHEPDLTELHFLVAEAQMWPAALESPGVLYWLALIIERHGQWLFHHGRTADACRCGYGAMGLARSNIERHAIEPSMVSLLANAIVGQQPGRRRLREGLSVLSYWREALPPSPDVDSFHFRDTAAWTLKLGRTDEAMELIQLASDAAKKIESPYRESEMRVARVVHSRILLTSGNASQAAAMLEAAGQQSFQPIWELLQWAETYLAAGNPAEAASWLTRFYEAAGDDPWDQLRPQAAAIAREL